MPSESPETRKRNFNEVAKGYSAQEAVEEANRCLNCKNKPCVQGCPVNVQIPDFISLIAKEDFEGAAAKIKESNLMPAICGRVCPQEKQCEGKCVRGLKGESVAIGRLERFAADYMLSKSSNNITNVTKNNKKVAIVGSGPSGLTCAGELARKGYDVTVFEALHKCGGVLVYGIPEFRLPKDIVQKEINTLESMGVKFVTNFIVGKSCTIDELFEDGFEAVYVGSGAGLPSFMGINGEFYNGVYSANEYLTRVNLMKAYKEEYDTPAYKAKNVCVIGGGNVAMDAARCAMRMGADKVTIVYRRTEKELPARLEEIEHAKEEGIEFSFLTSPIEIIGDDNNWVKSLKCEKMQLSEPDASGRARPIRIEGSEFEIEFDCVIMAIGNTLATTRERVFAGGDAVTGAATVILAMGAGKTAARSIDQLLS